MFLLQAFSVSLFLWTVESGEPATTVICRVRPQQFEVSLDFLQKIDNYGIVTGCDVFFEAET